MAKVVVTKQRTIDPGFNLGEDCTVILRATLMTSYGDLKRATYTFSGLEAEEARAIYEKADLQATVWKDEVEAL